MRTVWFRLFAIAALAGLLASCAGALTWMAYRREPVGPNIAGTVEMPGLENKVEVIRDRWGIPHIFAASETDLLRAMGYVQAQDRLFQMDMMRRVVEGRLAEVVGERPLKDPISMGGNTTLDQDIGMRILGFEHTAALFMELMPAEERARFEAFAEGVNAYIAQNKDNLPIEFGLIGYEPEPWNALDSIALSRLLAWGLASDARLELIRSAADMVLGPGGADKLLPIFNMETPKILPDYKFGKKKPSFKFDPKPLVPITGDDLTISTIYSLFGQDDSSRTMASNNWAVMGKRSHSGKPILANDPHLSHLAPSVFHLIHINGGGYDVIGAALPGVPYVILGHNRHVGWAATTCQADVQDVYLHKLDPNNPERYMFGDTWEDFVVREETVMVKEGQSFRMEKVMVRTSRFGPVVTDLVNKNMTDNVLSLRWTGLDFFADPDAYWELEKAGNPEEREKIAQKYRKTLRGTDAAALREVNRATSCNDYMKAMNGYSAPVQNWLCADDSGHIAYFAAGLVPVRNLGDGRRIARAWKNDGRWIGFIPPDELPQRMDPKEGFLATANNQTLDLNQYPYPWSYFFVPGDRAARIVELLGEKEKLDASDMSRIQGDITSHMAERFLGNFVQAAKQDEALTDARLLLERWDRVAGAESAGAALFYMAMDHLVRFVVEDDLGPDLYRIYSHFFQTYGARMQVVLDKKHPFHDSTRSRSTETWDVNYRRALSAAYARLQQELGPDSRQWRWGDIHTITNKHPLGDVPQLETSVNIGPFPYGGSIDTPWNAAFLIGADDYSIIFGPAYRHIVDMARPEWSWLIIDTGEWGAPLTQHYDDMNKLWRQNKLVPGLMARADIEMNVEGVLMLTPVDLP